MNARSEPVSLTEVADRLWRAAWSLDELRGDTCASEWTASKVRRLMRSGRADDAQAVLPLARALEARLAEDRPRSGGAGDDAPRTAAKT